MIKKVQHKLRKALREAVYNSAHKTFNYIPDTVKQVRGLRILVYHGVCKEQPHLLNARFLSEQQFEEHLVAINQCYQAVSFEDVIADNLSASRLNVLLTFDDGLKNNYTRALPLLQKHRIPAVFFVSALKNRSHYLFNDILDVFSLTGPPVVTLNDTAFKKEQRWLHQRYVADNGKPLGEYFHTLNVAARENLSDQIFNIVPKERFHAYHDHLELMSEEDICALSAQPGITLGSHGVTHADLSVITPDELTAELKNSKAFLEQITGRACNTLAFPYGNYNADVLSAASACGYTTLFGTEKLNRSEDRAHILERFTVNPYVSAINQMYYIAKQNYA